MKNPLQKALFLEYLTLSWNVIGCIVILGTAVTSSSISLFGFGIDSVIEIFASVVVIWQLKAVHKNRETRAMQLIGIAFLLLAAYLITESILAVIHHSRSHPSFTAIAWLIVTAIVMFLLAFGKKRIGTIINNTIVLKEANITVIDGLLAVSVLIGLLLIKYFEWWWADIVTSAILALYGLREAIQAFRYEH